MEGHGALQVERHWRGWAVNWHWGGRRADVGWSPASTSEDLPCSGALLLRGSYRAEPRCSKSGLVNWAQGGPVVHLGVGAAVVDWG